MKPKKITFFILFFIITAVIIHICISRKELFAQGYITLEHAISSSAESDYERQSTLLGDGRVDEAIIILQKM